MKERSYAARFVVLLWLGAVVVVAVMLLIVPVIVRLLSPLWFLP